MQQEVSRHKVSVKVTANPCQSYYHTIILIIIVIGYSRFTTDIVVIGGRNASTNLFGGKSIKTINLFIICHYSHKVLFVFVTWCELHSKPHAHWHHSVMNHMQGRNVSILFAENKEYLRTYTYISVCYLSVNMIITHACN